jgi:hypothetical protein
MPNLPDSNRPAEPNTGPSRPLAFDEVVALFVAFLSLGSVLFWGLTRGGLTLFGDSLIGAGATPLTPGQAAGNPPQAPFFSLGDADSTNTAPDQVGTDPNNSEAAQGRQTNPRVAISPSQTAQPNRNRSAAETAGIVGAAGVAANNATRPAPTANTPATQTPPSANLSVAATATPKDAITFEDVPDNYWAKPYIDALSSRELISGFEDGTFKPDKPVTRAEIANIVSRTFDLTASDKNVAFSDVEGTYWAQESIIEVVKGGFMSGFPNNTFSPNAPVTRAQAFTTLVTGLGVTPPTNVQTALARYSDASEIPDWADEKLAAATAGGFVVNYPNVNDLNPNEPTTRAELAAMIYQALSKEGAVEPIVSEYVVKP